MRMLRRHSALLTVLVLACISVQMLDLGLCCEMSAPGQPVEATVVVIDAAGQPDLAVRPAAPDTERGAADEAAQPDCLCHLVFTSNGVAPAVVAAAMPTSLLAEAPEPLRSALLPPPGHVPIA